MTATATAYCRSQTNIIQKRAQSTDDLSASPSRGILPLRRSSSGAGRRSDRDLFLLLALCLLCRCVPIVHHLGSQNGIQGKTSNEPVEDQLVIHLLQGCEDSGEGAHEVVEDLCNIYQYHASDKGFENLQHKRSAVQCHLLATQLESAAALMQYPRCPRQPASSSESACSRYPWRTM